MNSIKVSISVGKDEKVSGVLAVPANFQKDRTVGVILAHGAGNDMEAPLIVAAADGLCREGFLTLRFNFLYKEKDRKSPDSHKILVNTWHCVFEYLKEKIKRRNPHIFGNVTVNTKEEVEAMRQKIKKREKQQK